MKIRILISSALAPVGKGHVCDVDDELANTLIEGGAARALADGEPEGYSKFPHIPSDPIVAEVEAAAETPGNEADLAADEAADAAEMT